MAVGHVHSIKLDDNRYYHLFNLQFMSADEIDVIRLSLSGQPIPSEKLNAVNNLKKSIDEIINMAIVKDTQPASERIEEDRREVETEEAEDAGEDTAEEDKE